MQPPGAPGFGGAQAAAMMGRGGKEATCSLYKLLWLRTRPGRQPRNVSFSPGGIPGSRVQGVLQLC